MFDDDLKSTQQIDFTGNLDRDGNTTMFLITEEAKQTILDFSQGRVKALWYSSNLKTFIKFSWQF